MIIYGRNAVAEAMRGPRRISKVFATKSAATELWLGDSALVQLATGEEIEQICDSTGHQGVCAEVSDYKYCLEDELLVESNPFLVVLDQIQDPQNLGAICRTAECAGVTGVVIPERRASEVTAAVCKASAGAVEHLAIARVRNIADFLVEAKKRNIWCYGASAEARCVYTQPDYEGGVALVVGSEGSGLRPRVAKNCDQLISIPQRGKIDSLNVSAAAAVLIYAVAAER